MYLEIERLLKDLDLKHAEDNYSGWDVFDGLNSKIFSKTPFYNVRLFRLIWIQLFKRSPVNLRKLTLVPKGKNPKGMALFARGYINLYRSFREQNYLNKAYKIADELKTLRSKDRKYYCWGYNFPWEAKAFFVPAYKPNMIVSSFVAQAMLDLYEVDKNDEWLQIACDVGNFIENELKLYETEDELCFGYIPGEKTRVHNANLMGASLFSRIFSYTHNIKYKEFANKSVKYSIRAQTDEGAWHYGENSHHKWIDNFHTGYNLIAIKDYQKYVDDKSFQPAIFSGLTYHINNHFTKDLIPKYYNNGLYPIDIHNYAQGIITFITFEEIQKAELLIKNVLQNMFDFNSNQFYYQENKIYKIKIPYIRWAQAWMFFALSMYMKHNYAQEKN